MHRRTFLNLALLGLVAVLGIVAALAPGPDSPDSPGTLLPGVSALPSRIVIERPGKAALEFRRDGTAWYMRAPHVAPAHPRRIRELLEVQALPVITTLDTGRESWPGFGLAPATATLHLDDASISFGSTEALDGRRYVQQGGRVHLVAERVFAQMTQGAEFFVDPRLLREDLEPVHIETPWRRLVLVDGAWRDVAATAEPAAADVALAWKTLEAQAVQLAVDGGDGEPVTIGLAGGATIAFHFVEHDGRAWLARRDLGLRYLLGADDVRALALGAGGPGTPAKSGEAP